MPIWAQIVVPIAAAAGTLIVTTLINYLLGGPERIKTKRKNEHQEILNRIEELEKRIDKKIDEQNVQRDQLQADIGLLKIGTQTMLKNDLKLRYEHWLAKNYAPIDAKDDLEKMYQVYHSLGANGVMDSMRADFLDLPDERVVKTKNKTQSNGLDEYKN